MPCSPIKPYALQFNQALLQQRSHSTGWQRMPHLIDKVKNYVGDDSELKPYLPIIEENLNEKVSRIINDPAQPRKTSYSFKPQPTQVEEVKESARLCFDPMANWLILWYFFVFQAIIFYFTEVTIVLAYGSIAWQAQLSTPLVLVLNLVYIGVFIGDIYVQFNAGYITNSAIILNHKRVKYRYTHYYFYLDLILILAIVVTLSVQTYYLNYAKIIIVYKFLRMFEIDAIIIRKVSTWLQVRLVYEISKNFVTLYVLAHLWGIGFYIIDNYLLNQPICVNNPSYCWLNSCTAWSPISGLDWNLQYFYSLYWGINTMCQISYGDIAPNNPIETPWALAGMCFGFVVYSYIVNNIVKAIIWAKQKRDQFRVNLVLYDTYMDKLKVPMENQYEVVNFLKQRFKEQQNRNMVIEDLMKSNLPQDLKIEFTRSAYGHLAQGLDYFLGCDPAVTRMLFTIKEKKYSEDEKIIYQGAPLDQLCFFQKGVSKISCEHMHQHYLICQLNLPDTFLTTYQFFLNQQSPISVTSTENTVCYFIHRHSFQEQSIRDFEFKQSLELLQYDLLIRKRIDRIFYNCYFCRGRHHWYECQQSFPSFKEIDLSKMSNEQIYGRIRVVNRKHRTWKNYKELNQLSRIEKRNKDTILSRLETRIFALKKQLELRKDILEVDCAYDWPSYLPEENLTRFKEEWNGKVAKRNRKTTQLKLKINQ